MENASKALIMAGGVLIGVLIISLAVYLFVSFGQTSAEINSQNAQKQINQFNSQFTSYEGNNHLAGYDIKVDAHDVRWIYQIPLSEIQENKLINAEDQNP